MFERTDASMAQRVVLGVLAGALVAMIWWLLLRGGLEIAGGWLGWTWTSGDAGRRITLAAIFCIYYIRLLFTVFVFLKRGMSWSEVFTIAPWLLGVSLLLSISGGTNPDALGVVGGIGMVLFVAGSWMNSHAEYARHLWKRRPENQGRLYTHGLFRYSRHPNYFGDLVLFSGACLLAGGWITAIIPVLMLAGFVFVNIPVLDSHLHDHYGAAFDEYAKHTRKLIPFVY
ncbi:MAG TPA: DUF1295 domain-containing protein [Candidatus Acidoferrales bacterium]|nr:DUF1295 domain-containing protein [Candidatus Acidoferrales bacterium]